jgi:hypothetical protein
MKKCTDEQSQVYGWLVQCNKHEKNKENIWLTKRSQTMIAPTNITPANLAQQTRIQQKNVPAASSNKIKILCLRKHFKKARNGLMLRLH